MSNRKHLSITEIFQLIGDIFVDLLKKPPDYYDSLVNKGMTKLQPITEKLLFISGDVAKELHSEEINPVHLIISMLCIQESDAYNTLNDSDIVERKLLPFVKSRSNLELDHPYTGIPDISEDCKQVLIHTVEIAREKNHRFIGTAHILIGLMRFESEEINQILEHFDVQAKDIVKQAEYYLADDNTYERKLSLELIEQVNSITHRKIRIKQGLQSFGFGQSTKQGDE